MLVLVLQPIFLLFLSTFNFINIQIDVYPTIVKAK